MNRRSYLHTGVSLCVGAFAGCLSVTSGERGETDLAPSDDRDVETVATATFDEDLTPICADGESLSANIGGPNAEFVSAHEFIHDATGERYGIRGRIEPGERGNVPSVYAEFSDGTSASDQIHGVEDDETYLCTVLTDEGDPDAISSYSLTVRDGADADMGTVADYFATIEGEWGQIGTADGRAVYGCAATVTNESDEATEVYPRCNAYLDETTVAYSGTSTESVLELAAGETASVYFPYPRCDPGAIAAVETWLEWSTLNNP